MRPPLDRFFRGRFRDRSRKGFTITELLIAATISLILTYAVVQMFDYVASEARYGRASIELASQLRNASRRINTDLACATAPVRPFADRHGQGYFEYVEGPGTDGVAMMYAPGATATDPGTYTPWVRTSDIDGRSTVAVETSLGGDIDDILMFTAYNPDEPFRGRYTPYTFDGSTWVRGNTTVIESKYAEIAIWTVRQANGRVNLYRRTLLIRPDLSVWRDRLGSLPAISYPAPGFYTDPPLDPTVAADMVELRRKMQLCYQENDLSVRYEHYPANATAVPPRPETAALVCNTLSDLSRRENRFAHVRSRSPYLYPIDIEELQLHDPNFSRQSASFPGPPYPVGWTLTNDTTNNFYFEGNDVLLSEVLAFDVKAFDPLASIRLDENSFAMTPSDPGYLASAGPGGGAVVSLQTGAFVDLGYDETLNSPLPAANQTWFSGNGLSRIVNAANPTSGLVEPNFWATDPANPSPDPATNPAGARRYAFRTYCTGSQIYDMNGINEDGNRIMFGGSPVTDAGTNGIDDDGDGVVDNIAEWDVVPPYPYPLRGVQVTLRVMEPNSRQVRQMSVVQNFTGE